MSDRLEPENDPPVDPPGGGSNEEGLAETLKLPSLDSDGHSTVGAPAATLDGDVGAIEKATIRVSAGKRAIQRSRFGDYELLEEVSRGGMGVVYRARELRLNRIVALKMILAGELAGDDEVRRFRIEAEAAARLEHPCIVPIHEVGSVGNQHFYTMSFVEGAGLNQFREHGIGDSTRAARIIQQVAEAVDYAHLHGIVHRDLKPANVLLDEDGCPRITDFGLAKLADAGEELTRTGQILGTPGYMAPEQAAGECNKIGPPADIYALGSLLYFALTGRPPFQAANVIDTLVQSLESEPTMPRALNPLVPKPLEQVCMRCLERNPADRYPSAREVAKDLDRFLQGQPVHAHPPTAAERIRRFARRAPALSVHLIALTLLVLVAQLRYFTSSNPDLTLHLQVEGLLVFWIAVSIGLHLVGHSEVTEQIAGTALLCIDAALITVLLILLCEPGSPPGPLLIGYPLIIVGGAMFCHARRVVIVTAAAIVSYLALLIAEPYLVNPIHYQACFVIMLLAIAGCLIHQVRRVKTLSDYFESRR